MFVIFSLAMYSSLLLALLLGLQAQPGTIPETLHVNGLTSERLEGEFILEQYGYSVRIPNELIASGPYYDLNGISGGSHGFQGRLSHDPMAEIGAFAQYDPRFGIALQHLTTEEFVLSSSHPPKTHLTVVSRRGSKLGELPATRVVAKHQALDSAQEIIVDVIFAFRTDREVLYQLALRAPRKRYEQDKSVFDSLIGSFNVFPLPGEHRK